MKKWNPVSKPSLPAVALLGLALLAVSCVRAPGQTTVYTDGDFATNPGSWTDDANWSNTSPATIGSTAIVQIGTVPTTNNINLNTGGPTTIASLTFNASLTGSVFIEPAANETLQVNGAITNNSGSTGELDMPVVAGANATYVGSPGVLVFGSDLTVGTASILTAGSVQVDGDLIFTINSPTTFGTIGAITTSGDGFIEVNGNYTNTATAASDTGDFFKLTSGTFASGQPVSLPGFADSSLVWVSTLIQKGILFVELAAGGTVINSGVVLPIDLDSEFNPNGTDMSITFNGTSTAAELVTDNSEDGNNTPFSTSRAITINPSSTSVIAAKSGTTATYNGVISDAGGTPGAVTIGDAADLGTVDFNADNTYAGPTSIAPGATLDLASANAVQDSTVTINAGGNITFAPLVGPFALGGLSGNGNEALSSSGGEPIEFQVGNNNATTTYGGSLTGIDSSLTKVGTGTLILTGANTYSGVTTINNGTLTVTGSVASGITVNSGAALAGTGSTSAVTVAAGGSINLEDGLIGTLTVASLSIGDPSTPSTLAFDIQSDGVTTSVDQINDTGSLTLTGGTGTMIFISNLANTTSLVPGDYPLITYTGAQQPLTNIQLATTSLFGQPLSLSQVGDTIYLVVGYPSLTSGLAWTNTGADNNFDNGSNWTSTQETGFVPTEADFVAVLPGFTTAAIPELSEIEVSTGGNSTITINSPAGENVSSLLVSSNFGENTASNGVFNLTASTGTITVGSTEEVTGTATENYAGNLTLFGNLVVGTATSGLAPGQVAGSGTLNLDSGTTDLDNGEGNSIVVGNGTDGAINQSATSIVTTGQTLAIGAAGGTGTYTTTAGSALNIGTTGSPGSGTYSLSIGGASSVGALNIASGATLTATNANTTLAVGNGGTGTLTQDGTLNLGGAGSALNVGDATEGANGTYQLNGALIIGASNESDTVNLGNVQGSTGTLNQSTGSSLSAGTNVIFNVGNNGAGTYNLNGGTANFQNGITLAAGSNGSGSGTVNQNGGALVAGFGVIGSTGPGVYNLASGTATFNSDVVVGASGSIVQSGGTFATSFLDLSTNSASYSLNGGTLQLASGALSGTGALNMGGGTLQVTSAGAFADPVDGVLTATSNIDAATTAGVTNVNLSGVLSGPGGLNLVGGAGTIFSFTGANTYTGTTQLTSGTWQLASANVANSSAVIVAGGTLDVNGFSPTLQNFSSTGGTLTNSNEGLVTVTLAESASTTAVRSVGTSTPRTGNITGNLAINKTGPGLLTLAGTSTYSGGTTISAGTLLVGSATALGSGDLINSGTLQVLDAQHEIVVGGNYTQPAVGTLVINLNSPSNGSGLSASNDLLNVTGTASLIGTLDLNFAFTPFEGEQFTVIETGGGITTNATTPVSAQGYQLTDSVVGNNVVVTDLTNNIVLFTSQEVLHSFGDGSVANDGAGPQAALIQGINGNFYGTTSVGGAEGQGTIFEITPQGAVTILHSFGDGSVANDGNEPDATLVQASDGNFYGTTFTGGSQNKGTIFKMNPQGGVTILHNFGDGTLANDGSSPSGALIQAADGNFYGTTQTGGTVTTAGTVFKMTPQGTVTILHNFGDGTVANDGSNPYAGLIQGTDGNYYGTTLNGGTANMGTAFKMTPQGTVTILHNFGDGTVAHDGTQPQSGLIQGTDGNFYGTTPGGGSVLSGTAFKITPQGAVTILHNFSDGTVANDGKSPLASLIQGTDGNFYGTTGEGGSAGEGTAFKMTPQGAMTILHNFGDGSVANDGGDPNAVPVQGEDGNFYGTTYLGGSAGGGTVFVLTADLPALTSPATASGSELLPFSYQLTGSNTPTTFAATGLPSGLAIDPNTGIISGTPLAGSAGTYPVTVTLTNATGPASYTVTITITGQPVPQVVSLLTAYGSMGNPFSYQTVAINNVTGYSASGLTDQNLSIDPSTGIISGMPSGPETLTVSLTASNSTGTSAPVTLVIQILPTLPTFDEEYNVMHRFGDGTVLQDGTTPQSILQAFDGNFYGVTSTGGASGVGAVYQMNVQGLLEVFYSFTTANGVQNPTSLIQGVDGNFYGTTSTQIFMLTPSAVMTVLATFPAASNLNPLIQASDGNFYGTTQAGGSAGSGTLFQMTPQGVVTILHNFGDGTVPADGLTPQGALVEGSMSGQNDSGTVVQVSDGFLYGTTSAGGANNANTGTVFKINLPASGLTSTQAAQNSVESVLHGFGDASVAGLVTNDGLVPVTGLVQGALSQTMSGQNGTGEADFYGTTSQGGQYGVGAVYQLTPEGQVSTLYSFSNVPGTDGTNPMAPLILGNDTNLYGTTASGGTAGLGTVFQVTTAGNERIEHSFGSVANDGTGLTTPLVQDLSGNFYGVTSQGGGSNPPAYGTLFSIIPSQKPVQAPVFNGAAAATVSVYAPFSFTPKATFFASGSGLAIGNDVALPTGGSSPAIVHGPNPPSGNRGSATATYWVLSPLANLPHYLSFDSTSGTISGTPTQSGVFTFTMEAINGQMTGNPETVTLNIESASVIAPVALMGTVGAPLTYKIQSIPPALSYGATLLPAWLSIDPVQGIISGTPPASGTFSFNATASNSTMGGPSPSTQSITLTVAPNPNVTAAILTSSTSPSATVGAFFTYTIAATPAVMSTTAQSLPSGLLFNAQANAISGTPSAQGAFTIPVTATTSSGTIGANLSLTVGPPPAPSIAANLLATAIDGTPFSYRVPATGVVSNYSTTSPLPAGLTLDNIAGVLSGTPTVTGTFPISITVANGTGSGTTMLSLAVVAPATFAMWATAHNNFMGLPNATSYDDGVPNLLKFLYDIDPSQPISATDRNALAVAGLDTTTNPGTTYLALTYRQYASATGITVHFQTSPDLQNWTTAMPDIDQQIGTDSGDPVMEMGVETNGANHLFIRIDVTSP